ncbi:Gldg family protein [Mariniblastus sp.]|nr:Gldg family protein [Mariniblastus sp.]
MIRWHVVSAVFWRNVKQYFSGVLGYLFIVVFVTVCAVMAFSPQFFADNLANLDQLSRWFPMLLLFFIPAITMSVWADEKRQGTDSILFTLPASDLDILLGKYLSVAAVYTIALLFSMTQLIVLALVGSPDWGVIATTYVGYWLAGLALLAVGMFASSLTSSSSVAFVLGALFCAVPVLIGAYFRGFAGVERLGFEWNLRDFTLGLIPLTNVIYFVSLTLLMLYLNLVVVGERHWRKGQQSTLLTQFAIRAVSLAVGLLAFNYLCGNAISSTWSRTDLTNEKLYTLDDATVETLQKVKEDEQLVTVQAFISRDVPRKFVNTKKQLEGLLRQFDEYGGQSVDVRYVDVTPNSQAEIDARFVGVEPESDRSEVGGRMVEQDVFLGVNIFSQNSDVTLPFLGEGASLEYELSRSIATVADESDKLTIGILETDAHFGGPDMDGRRIPWAYNSALEELKKQFSIKYVEASDLQDYLPKDEAGPGDSETDQDSDVEAAKSSTKTAPNVMIVADPSSLDQAGMSALFAYLKAGNKAVVLADPLPFFWTYQNPTGLGVLNAPRLPRIPAQSQYADILTSSPNPKASAGTAAALLELLGIEWDNGRTVWGISDPHPGFKGEWPGYLGNSWPEYYGPYEKAFVYVRDHGGSIAFNPDSNISNGLNELLMFYPGTVKSKAGSELTFTPLATLGSESGTTDWEFLTKTPTQQVRMFDPRTGQMSVDEEPARSQITGGDLVVIDPQPRKSIKDEDEHVVAARITGEGDNGIDVVFITDSDFVSDLTEQQEEGLDQRLDNLAFLQNAIEVLAGNEDFVRLRNRRTKPRTLVKLESIIEKYKAARTVQQQEAETGIRDELEAEQEKLTKATEKIEDNESLSFFQKMQRTSQEASDAQRRFDLRKKKLDRELTQQIAKLETEEQNKISRLENSVRYASIFAAPLPALLLGIFVLAKRRKNEQKNIAPERRVDEA